MNPADVASLESDAMTIRLHYRTITGYTILPARCREVLPPRDDRSPTEKYLWQVDALIDQTQSRLGPATPDDLVSLVFANQAVTAELGTHQLAGLIEEHRALTQRQIEDIQRELEELRARKPFRPRYMPGDDGTLTEIERVIFDLEKQQRALELTLWRDTQKLRTSLVTQRREQDATQRRITYLLGGSDGGFHINEALARPDLDASADQLRRWKRRLADLDDRMSRLDFAAKLIKP